MKTYYNRNDVVASIYEACQHRNVSAALRGKHWDIGPHSQEHLLRIINEAIQTKIEPFFSDDSDCLSDLRVSIERVHDLENPYLSIEKPDNRMVLWHGTTEERVNQILNSGLKTQATAGGLFFSPSFGFSRHIAEQRAKVRGTQPVVFCCLFEPEQSQYLVQTTQNEFVWYPGILSFHADTSLDLIFEADSGGWRQSFGVLAGAITMLDDFEVYYRLKYSGVRSLHLMIPIVLPVFHNAYRRAKRFDASEVERSHVLHQLELMLRLRNSESPNTIDELALFQAADELIQYGHDLREIVLGLLFSGGHAINGAIRLLGHLRWEDSADLLIQQFNRSRSPHKSAFESIVALGESTVEALIEGVRTSPYQRVVISSIEALGQIADERAIPVLRECSTHQNGNVRHSAIRALKEQMSK